MTLSERLWTYQAERFPLIQTVPLLALFSAAAINVSAVLAGRDLPGPWTYIAGFLLGVILFFQMRVADEHKDYLDDCRYRPERAVPRGLVSLKLLARLGGFAGLLAVLIVLTRPIPTAICLVLTWAWFALMSREFFVPDWLKARPILYLVSHMAIMPLIDLMLTSLEWAGLGAAPDLWIFLVLSFFNGCVLEIGRKIWAAESERDGVDTYSKLWGRGPATLVWFACVAVSSALMLALGIALGSRLVSGAAVVGLLGPAVMAGLFLRRPDAKRQKGIDAAAGVWVAFCYAACGFLPFLEGAA